MYKCNDCEAEFEYPAVEKEYMGMCGEQPAYQEFGYCPECGSDDFYEVYDYDEEEEEEE